MSKKKLNKKATHTKKETKQVHTHKLNKGLCPNKVSLHYNLNLHRNYLLSSFNVRLIWLMDISMRSNETIAQKTEKSLTKNLNLQRCVNETKLQGDSKIKLQMTLHKHAIFNIHLSL